MREHPSGVLATAAAAGRVFGGPRTFPWVMLAIAAGAGLLDHAWTAAAAPWPFVVALCAFGMPHGAADWTVSARLSGRCGAWSRLAGFAGYLAMMLASLAVIMWQPGVAALLFLLLTVFHFGMADATAVLADDDGPVARWGLVLGRGLLLLSTAFASHPEEAWEPFARIGAALSPSASPWQPGIAVLRDLAAVGVAAGAALAACSAVARIRAGHAREAALDLAEHALVATLAAAADPLFAVGCFFLGVHAFRHSRRLACTRCVIEAPHAQSSQGRPAASRSGLVGRLLRVHVASLPLMWPTAACLAVLCWLIGGADARTLADASIAFYMITTLPHHLLGLRLPRPDMPPAKRAA